MSDFIEIQIQDESGNWRTMAATINDSQVIRARMNEVKSQHPNSRVRAVDGNGRLVDLI